MRKENIKLLVAISVICLIFLAFAIFFGYKRNADRMAFVDRYSIYFNVVEEVNDYINYITVADRTNIYNLLDEKYINNNKIDYDNLFNYVGDYTGICSVNTKNIYYIELENGYLYYLEGSVVMSNYEEDEVVNDDFRVVVLNDTSNDTYSIYPVNRNNYKKVINSFKTINIDGNSSNKSVNSNSELTTKDLCKMFFSNFISKLFYNTESAYEILDDDMLKEYRTFDEFNNYIRNNFGIISGKSKSCDYEKVNNKNVYTVIDTNNNVYIFTENYVMNYNVNFSFK